MVHRWAVLIGCALAVCCGCSTQPSRALPPDWPIAQLALAPAWELKTKATAMHQLDPVQYPEPQWLVAFDNTHDWPGVIAHVESCLKPLQYLRSKSHGTNNPLGLDLPETRTYYSPDYLTEVLISDGVYFDAIQGADAEFALQIKRYATPPDPIGAALSLNQSRPGSGMGDEILARLLEPIS